MSKNKVIRILVPGNDLDNTAISNAISFANELCKQEMDNVDDVILFIPTKQNILGTSLTTILGESTAKKLHKGESVLLPCRKKLSLETIRTFRRKFKKSIVIAVYVDEKMMDQVDPMNDLFAIIAVPYLDGELDNWKRTWSPLVLGENELESETVILIKDAIVESALISLTGSINLSHAILNPRDKDTTNRTVRILRRNNHIEDASNIRSWAVKNQWHPKAADELKKTWEKVYSLKNKPKILDPETAKRQYDY